MARNAIGLDIGSSTVKFVEVSRKGKQVTVTNYGMLPNTPKTISRGRVQNAPEVGNLLQSLVRRYELKSKNVVLGLNSPEINVRLKKLPKMSKEELEQALEFELEELAGFKFKSPDDVAFSYDYNRQDETDLEILFVACPRGLLTPYIDVCRASGLELSVIDLQALTWPGVFTEIQQACFVDIGFEQTTIYV